MILDRRSYLQVMLKWLWLLLLAMFLAAAIGLGVSIGLTPQYEASLSLLVRNGQASSTTAYNDLLAGTQLAQTYAQLIQQRPVLDGTIARLGLPVTSDVLATTVTARLVPNTQLVELRVRASDPNEAALIANTIGSVFIQQTEARERGTLQNSTQYLQTQLTSLEGQVSDSERRIAELRAESSSPGQQAAIAAAQTQLANFQSSYSTVLKNMQDIRISNAAVAGTVAVVQPAAAPLKPVSPRIPLNVALSALLGLLVATGAVALFEYFDDKLGTPERIHLASGLPTLGRLFRIKGAPRDKARLVDSSAESEAYRKLRTNLEFCSLDNPWRTLLVTSPGPGDGKTTVACNLALMLAQEGKRVILVDLDLRRPSVHTQFGVENHRGATSLLLQDGTDPGPYLTPTSHHGLQLLTAGPLPPNPAELLGSPRLEQLLQLLRTRADAVVLDSSPVLAVTDPAVLSARADATLLVVNAQRSHVRQLRSTVESLQTVGARILGIALNYLKTDSPNAYYYYSSHTAGGGASHGRSDPPGAPATRSALAAPNLAAPWPLRAESAVSSSIDDAP